MVERLGNVGYASNLVNLVIFFVIKDSQYLICTHSVRSIILYIACIMSFIWRSGVTSTTPPGLSDTGLLAIRIAMTIVLGIGVLYGFLIMATFQRYGAVMDKAWKQRIDKWIAEKATGNKVSFPQPALGDLPYPPSHWSYPDRSARYQPSTYDPSLYYQPSFGAVDGRYFRNAYAPAPHMDSLRSTPSKSYTYAQPVIIPIPDSPYSTSSKSDETPTINRPGPNYSASQLDPRFPQPSLGGMTSADIPNPGATTPLTLNPKGPVATARLIPQRAPRSLNPNLDPSLTPSEDEDNAVGFSSGLENKSSGGNDAPDDGNRVRFRLPSGSSGSSNRDRGFLVIRKTHPRKTPKGWNGSGVEKI